MLRDQKNRVSKNLEIILSGNFGEINVRSLFMELRPFTGENQTFLEFSHLVAHPSRDKGVVKNWLSYFEVWSNFQHDYFWGDKQLDVLKPFPSYILKILNRAIAATSDTTFDEFLINKDKIKSYLKKKFLINNSMVAEIDSKFVLRNQNNPAFHKNINGLVKVLDKYVNDQVLNGCPCFTQEQIIKSIIDVLKINGIVFKESYFRVQSNKIMLHILCMLHNSEYKLNDGTIFKCRISGIEYRIENEKLISKHLGLRTDSEVKNQKFQDITVPVMNVANVVSTDLPAFVWCNESLFENLGPIKAAYSEHDLEIDSNGKLTPILPYEGRKIVDVTFSI